MVPRSSREVALKQKTDWWTAMAYELAYVKAKIPSWQSLQALHMNYQGKQWIKHRTCVAAPGEIQKGKRFCSGGGSGDSILRLVLSPRVPPNEKERGIQTSRGGPTLRLIFFLPFFSTEFFSFSPTPASQP
jgi:hypothetical protein